MKNKARETTTTKKEISKKELGILNNIITELSALASEDQYRILRAVVIYLELGSIEGY